LKKNTHLRGSSAVGKNEITLKSLAYVKQSVALRYEMEKRRDGEKEENFEKKRTLFSSFQSSLLFKVLSFSKRKASLCVTKAYGSLFSLFFLALF